MEKKYYITKDICGTIILLSSYPTYHMSGYFSNYQQQIICLSQNKYSISQNSSREGLIKEKSNLEFKPLSKALFIYSLDYIKIITDLIIGFFSNLKSTVENPTDYYFGHDDDGYNFFKLYLNDKATGWEILEKKDELIRFRLAKYNINKDKFQKLHSISSEMFDTMNDLLQDMTTEIYQLLNNTYFES